MKNVLQSIKTALNGLNSFEDACASVVTTLRQGVPRFNWVGIYLKEGDELRLAAWDGPEETKHVRIPIGQGICGLAIRTAETVVVADVNADPRYLACFSHTRAEIVVPIFGSSGVIGEIDIDSDTKEAFIAADQALLEEIAALLGTLAKQE